LAATAAVALLLEVPAGLLLTELGGIECPTRCGTGQDVAQGLFFLGFPLTVLVLLVAALLSRARRA